MEQPFALSHFVANTSLSGNHSYNSSHDIRNGSAYPLLPSLVLAWIATQYSSSGSRSEMEYSEILYRSSVKVTTFLDDARDGHSSPPVLMTGS